MRVQPMSEQTSRDDPLPNHVESTVQAVASLHAEHETSANRSERLVAKIAGGLGRPIASLTLLGLAIAWMGLNVMLVTLHLTAFDRPPFNWLNLFVSLGAALMTLVILASQCRTEILANRRSQLGLQLAFISDHKQAKIIALLEELRRDDPLIKDRPDRQAQAMTEATDSKGMLAAIEETREGLVGTSEKAKL